MGHISRNPTTLNFYKEFIIIGIRFSLQDVVKQLKLQQS